MPSCWTHHCRYINSFVSLRLSPLLRRSYVSAKPIQKAYPGSKSLTPYQPSPLIDSITKLKDPVKLADNVRHRLQYGDIEGALTLTRQASRVMDSVVSWNHIINYYLEHSYIKHALTSFNDMKKRHINPDSHTFTLILNGLASCTNFSHSLPRALQLYKSLYAPNSPVDPNVFHTNAVLKVCVRAGNLDPMWNILEVLPTQGPNAPNTMTYTILLGGIGATEDKSINVEDARRIWAGVLSRYDRGQLSIDEGLACAMGRVLLTGERKDWKEVFTLCEQVFGIETLVPKEPPKPATKNPAKVLKTVDTEAPKPNTQTVCAPVAPTHFPKRPVPRNATLSLILKTCTLLKDETLASKYWDKLTNKPYYIKPDLDNYHDMLRVLRRFRLGAEALEVVESMRVKPSHKTFFIAMSSCKRHGRSNSFNSAERLLDLMVQKYGLTVDVKVWNMFLQSALKAEEPSYIKKALRYIDEELDIESELRKTKPGYTERALELVRGMVGAVEMLVLGEELTVTWGHGERAVFERRGQELRALVTRYGAGAKKRTYKVEMKGEDWGE